MVDSGLSADPQFGITKILRPYAGFEAVYTGKVVGVPIMFTEVLTPPGGKPLDDMAGQPGYSPLLLRGISVPVGSRIIVWLPNIFGSSNVLNGTWNYDWTFTWRLRSVFDFRQSRIPFHYPKQAPGIPDTLNAPPTARVVIPGAVHSMMYTFAKPVVGAPASSPTVSLQADIPSPESTGIPRLPLIPGGANGYYQQGIFDPATSIITASGPMYIPFELQSMGDELLIGMTRTTAATNGTGASATWNFADVDLIITNLFGAGLGNFPDIGVYVMMGFAP